MQGGKKFFSAARIMSLVAHRLDPQLLRSNPPLAISNVQLRLGEMRLFLS
ncbi:hypothetical protein [Methylobacterium sp. R2-1]|nr:hypothetical protein [Methylobacterium sp. R2-1]MBB2964459.1 hypothetical protein [Methylobacterium sp. R2-1]